MMDYEQFKERVLSEFIDYLPIEYSDCRLELHKVTKINEVLTGVAIVPENDGDRYAAPTFYLERLYEQYRDAGNFEECLSTQSEILMQSVNYLPRDIGDMDFSSMTGRIVFQLVNRLRNTDMIANCPHRDYLDLTVVYRMITDILPDGVSGFLINDNIARSEHWTEAELYDMALRNTPELFPYIALRIEEMMGRIMSRCNNKDFVFDDMFPEFNRTPPRECVYVASNDSEYLGATVLLYPEFIKAVAGKIGTDCYLLPSSIHEIIILSSGMYKEAGRLAELVRSTNESQVSVGDRLSDSIYLFSRDKGSIQCIDYLEREAL
ncbi:MAG: DUF5688 family protein [Mageeibacillus sp.]|jgi:hypothetical protein|nr:DUF5688 family protein [Mageeibacillus sp.]MCI1263377.1 DUF5688 family protein [Saccharofermentans sp.]MCI1769046.1 DUF5688 family protein [Mageeibacillus sp.]MCI2043974.1 DUF5688 family protein [Mageeibacillus sp.]